MPTGQPFTRLCQRLARSVSTGRADLHLHTTHSDGDYSPSEIVDLARRSGLAAIAVTDHDTICGIAAAKEAAGSQVEVIPGVEATTEYDEREVHLLGYFVRTNDVPLNAALGRLRERRKERFHGMVERLRGQGVSVDEEATVKAASGPSPGRRTLATLLHSSGRVGSVREAFARWLADGRPADLPKARLPLAEAIDLLRGAGGVTSLAHPSAALKISQLTALRDLGLQAIEVDYPSARPAREKELRQWAATLGLAVTGGSDCHGPDGTAVGACSVTADELASLRELASD